MLFNFSSRDLHNTQHEDVQKPCTFSSPEKQALENRNTIRKILSFAQAGPMLVPVIPSFLFNSRFVSDEFSVNRLGVDGRRRKRTGFSIESKLVGARALIKTLLPPPPYFLSI